MGGLKTAALAPDSNGMEGKMGEMGKKHEGMFHVNLLGVRFGETSRAPGQARTGSLYKDSELLSNPSLV